MVKITRDGKPYKVVRPEDFFAIAEALTETQDALTETIKRLIALEEKVG